MKYIKPYKIFEDVHYDDHPKPNWFYVALRESGQITRRNKDHNTLRVWESLSTMHFDGLRGVSDNDGIVNAWFDVRPMLLIMPGKETIKENNMHPIYYFNADQMVSDNFKILIRVLQNEDATNMGYSITSTLTKIFQNMTSITKYGKKWKGTIGSRKQAKIHGTWSKRGNREYLYKIIKAMNESKFYYKTGNYILDRIKQGFVIKNMGHFAKLVGESIEHNRDEFMKSSSWERAETFLQYLCRHYDKYGTKYIEKVLRWAVGVTGKIYHKNEGEWIMKKDKNGKSELNVPNGSHLFIKISPDRENEEEYNNWFNKKKEDGENYGYDTNYKGSTGLTIEYAKEMIELYHLDKQYTIHFVRNFAHAGHLLKTKFSNK